MAQPQPAERHVLRPLGIVGYDALEPALLAALATGEPLLLVSDHGAAKSLLLVRLAEALDLELRHYNASILQFDDLAGFPIPDDRGGIRYAAPPGAIWNAEADFLDEIGRCRPEVANKLFPIVHERRLQGVSLERLRYRWAATNPPPDAQDDGDARYLGVEPLDPALADRFAWILSLPPFADLGDDDRRQIISGAGETIAPEAGTRLRELVQATQALIPTVRTESGAGLATYVDVFIARLREADIVLGGRRAATLWRNLIAIRAAHLALGLGANDRAVRAGVLASIPDIVRRHIPRATILAAHEAAWREVALDADDPRRTLLGVRDPLQRALLALTLPRVKPLVRGEALCSALAELPRSDAQVVAWAALEHVLDTRRVPATAAETVATLVAEIAKDGVTVRGYSPHRAWAVQVRATLSKHDLPVADLEYLHGVLATHAVPSAQQTGFALPAVEPAIDRLLEVLRASRTALAPLRETA